MIHDKHNKLKLISKLCFGTANFANNYGILKKKNNLSKKKIKNILELLKKNKISNIDTAIFYKNVEKKIGHFNLKNFSIFTKLPKLPKKCTDIKKWSLMNINHSLNNLNKKRLPGVFIHHSEDLIGKNKIKLYEALLSLKKKKLINKIGVSIYNFNTLDKILDEFKIDMIQVPFNILDRRLITKNYLNISSNHLYLFFLLSILGLFCYFNHSKFKFLIYYLFFLSIVLELFHMAISERLFEFQDLAGNILGVTISCFIALIYKHWRKL